MREALTGTAIKCLFILSSQSEHVSHVLAIGFVEAAFAEEKAIYYAKGPIAMRPGPFGRFKQEVNQR
tara:strand:- start:342 stop:542 length:201 start_codon:yes stop_codon:yes gene_type:complete